MHGYKRSLNFLLSCFCLGVGVGEMQWRPTKKKEKKEQHKDAVLGFLF